ncbi:MAG: hypothetical protein HRT87_03550 [Legionellales bacterium]|nr:hypothetical protein [Legionellales bacterium]
MSLLEEYKKQLLINLHGFSLDKGNSYMDAMVGVILRNKFKMPIISDEHEVLIRYCTDHNVRAFERTSYLMMIQYIYLTNLSKVLERKINQLNIQSKDNLIVIDELQKKTNRKDDSSKDNMTNEIEQVKNKLTQAQGDLEKLKDDKENTLKKIDKLKKYFGDLEVKQKEFEKKSKNILQKRKSEILRILENLYNKDENNQLGGFVFFIKEAYKKSLQKRNLKNLLNDISISITEMMFILSKNIGNNNSQPLPNDWFLKEVFDSLSSDEKVSQAFSIDIKEENSLVNSLDLLLSIVIGIHRVVARHQDEKNIKVDFVKKIASLKIDMEIDYAT